MNTFCGPLKALCTLGAMPNGYFGLAWTLYLSKEEILLFPAAHLRTQGRGPWLGRVKGTVHAAVFQGSSWPTLEADVMVASAPDWLSARQPTVR